MTNLPCPVLNINIGRPPILEHHEVAVRDIDMVAAG